MKLLTELVQLIKEEDCQYEVVYTDEAGNILTEGATRMFKRVGKKIIRKYRCTSGPKKGGGKRKNDRGIEYCRNG